MKYSVVIPLYNKKNYICRTLQSVLRQSFEDFEVIIVDDGSTDGSADAVREMVSEKVHLVMQENQGVSVARNTGIEKAQGEYIAFLDADDEWNDNYLETIDDLTKRYPVSDIYVTAYRIDMGNGKSHYSTRLEPETGCLESYWLTFRYAYDFVWTSATVIKKEAIIKAGKFRPGEKIGQDLDLWSRVAGNNPRVAYSSNICVNYNRAAEANARTRVKIARAGAFMRNLERELRNPERTKEEREMIQHKYDLKMTAYIYTSILSGDRSGARKAMRSWKGKMTAKNCALKAGLSIAMLMPERIIRMVYAIRLKVF